MQMKMTEKDKKLIVFLSVFVILVVGGYWGIYPMVRNIISYNSQIQDARDTKEMNEVKIAQVPLLETDNDKLEAQIKEQKNNFFPVMTSDQVDRYMTGLILDYQLYAYDLDIHMPEEEAAVEPYQYSEKAKALENLSHESAQDSTGVTADSDTGIWSNMEDISTGISAVEVTMRVGGDRTHIQKLIDELSTTDQKLHLTGYSWDEQRSITYQDDGTFEVDTEYTLTMTINLYMCEGQEWK